MIPKKIRLTTALFDQVFKTGRVQHSERFWMRSFLLPVGLPSRFAVAVPKKVGKTAVMRNKTKRLVYKAVEVFDKAVLANQSGHMVIFGVKKDVSKLPFTEIAQEIKDLLLKNSQK